jgi:hypothetical protein
MARSASRRAALLALLAFSLAAPAAAEPLTPGAGLTLAESMARDYWRAQGAAPCAPVAWQVDDLDTADLDVVATATPAPLCLLTLDRETLGRWRVTIRYGSPYDRRAVKRERCAAIDHEFGHLAALMFPDPSTPTGFSAHSPDPGSLMAAVLRPENAPSACWERWPEYAGIRP